MHTSRWIGLVIAAMAAAAAAQVPLIKDPMHKVVFENAQFRIFDVNIPAGRMSSEHRHDLDIATVSMSDGPETRTQISGQPQGAPVRRMLGEARATEYAGKPLSHRIENLGKSAYQLFAVENLRTSGWSSAPAAKGLGTTITAESRSFRLYDVRLTLAAGQTSHTHPVPAIAVLLGGKVMSQGPDTHAKANAPAAVGLKQLDQPGQWVLVPAGDTHYVVRLGPTDARVAEIEVR